MSGRNGLTRHRICALFVDFDNFRLGVPDPLPKTDTAIEILRKLIHRIGAYFEHGQIPIRRAYADWEDDGLDGVQAQLALMSFVPVFVLGQSGKNSADLEMSLDCQQILLSRDDVENFILVTGDRDFIPVVRRIMEQGKDVRIAAFRRAASADLVEIVGRENFLDLGTLLKEHQSDASVSRTSNGNGRTIEEALAESDDEDFEITEADMDKAIELVIQADRKYRGRGVWLVPFFKDWMNPNFGGTNNEGRKAILSALSDEGSIEITTREDGLGRSNSYSVIVPNREHERFVRASEQLGVGSEGGE